MSVTVDGEGRAVVLDQVNGRIVRFGADGKSDSVRVTQQAPQDVAVAKNGTLVVLDRLADKSIALVDANGKALGEIPIEGKGVPEGGGVTGVIVDGDDIYVEREHATLVHVGDANGGVDENRPELPGRPTRDGKYLVNAGIGDAHDGRVRVTLLDRATGNHLWTRVLQPGEPVAAILLLDSDASGGLYLALLALPDGTKPETAHVLLLLLDAADGHVVNQRDLQANHDADETFREFTVKLDGTVVYVHRDEEGTSLEEYRLR